MKFEECFSFEAIVGDLIRWRVNGKGTPDENGRRDVEKVLPARKAWCRAGVKERKGVAPEVVRRQAIWRTVRRACGDVFGFAAGTAAPHTGGPQFIAAGGERGAGGGMAVATSCDPPGERGAGGLTVAQRWANGGATVTIPAQWQRARCACPSYLITSTVPVGALRA